MSLMSLQLAHLDRKTFWPCLLLKFPLLQLDNTSLLENVELCIECLVNIRAISIIYGLDTASLTLSITSKSFKINKEFVPKFHQFITTDFVEKHSSLRITPVALYFYLPPAAEGRGWEITKLLPYVRPWRPSVRHVFA